MALPQRYVEHFEKDSHTEDEDFEFERCAFGRWEFVPTGPPAPDGCRLGDIRAMSGGTPDHSAIAGNIIRSLGNILVLRGSRVFGSDLKVHTGGGLNTFPDVSVVCGPLSFYAKRKDTITNPALIVEVLSESTQDYDRAGEFEHYQIIPALTDYLLVAQDRAHVVLYTRCEDHWEMQPITGLENTITLPSMEVIFALSEIYALVDFGDQ